MTADDGSFDFSHLKPGTYQLRCQTPGDRTWFDAGRPFRVEHGAPEADARKIKSLEWPIAPFKKGRWTRFGVLDGLPTDRIGRIIFAPDNVMWLASANGLSRFDGREFFSPSREDGFPFSTGGDALALHQDANGVRAMWSPWMNAGSGALALHQDTNGVLWIGANGLWRYNPADGKPPARFNEPGLPTDEIQEITSTTDGAIWWRTQEALVRYRGERGTVFTNLWRKEESKGPFAYLLHFPRRLAVAGDRLWLTGPGVGLIRFEGTNQIRFGRQQGLVSEDTGTVTTAPDGAVWLAVGKKDINGVARFNGTHFSYLTQREGLPAGWVTCIHVTPDDQVWLATAAQQQQIVARFDGRSFTQFGNSGNLTDHQNSYAGSHCWDIQRSFQAI